MTLVIFVHLKMRVEIVHWFLIQYVIALKVVVVVKCSFSPLELYKMERLHIRQHHILVVTGNKAYHYCTLLRLRFRLCIVGLQNTTVLDIKSRGQI